MNPTKRLHPASQPQTRVPPPAPSSDPGAGTSSRPPNHTGPLVYRDGLHAAYPAVWPGDLVLAALPVYPVDWSTSALLLPRGLAYLIWCLPRASTSLKMQDRGGALPAGSSSRLRLLLGDNRDRMTAAARQTFKLSVTASCHARYSFILSRRRRTPLHGALDEGISAFLTWHFARGRQPWQHSAAAVPARTHPNCFHTASRADPSARCGDAIPGGAASRSLSLPGSSASWMAGGAAKSHRQAGSRVAVLRVATPKPQPEITPPSIGIIRGVGLVPRPPARRAGPVVSTPSARRWGAVGLTWPACVETLLGGRARSRAVL